MSQPRGGKSAQSAATKSKRSLAVEHVDRAWSCPDAGAVVTHFMVGIENSASSLMPDGQRAVTVFVLV